MNGYKKCIGRRVLVPLLPLFVWASFAGCAKQGEEDGDADGGAEEQGDAAGSVQVSGPGELVAEPEDESAFFWNQTEVVALEIEISPDNLALLDADPTAEQYVEALLKHGTDVYPGIGLRYKGSYGGWVGCFGGSFGTAGGLLPGGAKTCPKLSMKVSFDWLDTKGNFHGVDKLNLASMNEDASHMRERLGYHLFRQFDLAAPRTAYVRLAINGNFQGLFLAVEEVDKRFARSRFTEGGEGNIYKEIWPDETDPLVYEPSLRANRRDPDHVIERVVRFAQALEEAPDDAAVVELSDQWLDNDYIMRYVAADRTISFDDGIFHWYCSGGYKSGNNPGPCSNHNYFWYEETGHDRLWLIAWDVPLSMQSANSAAGGFTGIVDEWNDTEASCEQKTNGYPISPPQVAPACDKLTHGWATLRDPYASAVRAFLEGPFAREAVNASLDVWSAQIASVVQEAAAAGQGPNPVIWRESVNLLRAALDELRTSAEARAN